MTGLFDRNFLYDKMLRGGPGYRSAGIDLIRMLLPPVEKAIKKVS